MSRTRTTITRAGFVVDPTSVNRTSGRQYEWSLIPDSYRIGAQTIVVGAAGATAGATTIPVLALPQALSRGTLLRFGTDAPVAVTNAAVAGALSIQVTALADAVVSGDRATYNATGGKHVPASTVVVELENGKVVPRAVRPDDEPARFVAETNAEENSPTDALSGYGMITGGVLKENLMVDAVSTGGGPKLLPQEIKDELNASGTGYSFELHSDSRQ